MTIILPTDKGAVTFLLINSDKKYFRFRRVKHKINAFRLLVFSIRVGKFRK